MKMYAKLVDENVVELDSIDDFMEHLNVSTDRIPTKINRTITSNKNGIYMISTVFLGMNHGFSDSKNLWFETMIFECGEDNEPISWLELYCDRYETYNEAKEGHDRAVLLVENGEIL